jgi:Holliday junction resolvase RusA-like endonuclease
MTTELQFTVPGQPFGKERPRAAKKGKFITIYTPQKTVSYEGLIAHTAMVAMMGRKLIMGAVSVDLDIRVSIPASWSKKRQAAAARGEIAVTKKPDIDNVIKGIFDGMNGVVWLDDRQVIEASQKKRYAETPGVIVIVRELDMGAA